MYLSISPTLPCLSRDLLPDKDRPTIRKVHSDIYQLVPSSVLVWLLTSLLCCSFRYFPFIFQVDTTSSALHLSKIKKGENDIHPNPFLAFFVLDVQLENTVRLSI